MIELIHIGKSADDLRFFIREDGMHAGGVTVHSVQGTAFSYGIAVAPHMRRRGVARAALPLLYAWMKRGGYDAARVQIAPDNAASLALHASLGFAQTGRDDQQITLERAL